MFVPGNEMGVRGVWMGMRIYKYEIPVELNAVGVNMPAGAKIIEVGESDGKLCVWAEVDPDAPARMRSLWVFGTGWDIEDRPLLPKVHLGTAHIRGFVWHVYQLECDLPG